MTDTQTAALRRDIDRMAEQERRLRLAHFDESVAWTLGEALKRRAEACGAAVTIEVRLARETVFFHAMAGTTPANADWARRKRNAVELLQQSSYALGQALALEGSSLEAKMGLPTRDYGCHGGSFPLRLVASAGGACVGVVTVSGLPQREDHAMVVAELAALCGVDVTDLALD